MWSVIFLVNSYQIYLIMLSIDILYDIILKKYMYYILKIVTYILCTTSIIKNLKCGDVLDRTHILWIGRVDVVPFFSVKKHVHPYYHMFYIEKGSIELEIDGETHELLPGCMIVVPLNAEHSYVSNREEAGELLEVKFSLDESAFEDRVLRENVHKSDDELAGALFKKIYNEYSSFGEQSDKAAISYLQALLNILCEKERYQKKRRFHYFTLFDCSELSGKIIEYLEEHFHEELSLDALAGKMGFNKSYMCVAFKKDTRMTILDCLNTIRVRRAAELVVYSERSLTQVAKECGFSNDNHFNRVFMKYTGITPRQCRRASPAGVNNFPKGTEDKTEANNFLYSVLAHKSITRQEVKEFDLIEDE